MSLWTIKVERRNIHFGLVEGPELESKEKKTIHTGERTEQNSRGQIGMITRICLTGQVRRVGNVTSKI